MRCVSVFYKSRPDETNTGNREGCRPVLRRDGEGQTCQGEGKSSPAERRERADPWRGERSRRVEEGGCQGSGEGGVKSMKEGVKSVAEEGSEGEGEGAEDGVLETDGGLGDLGGAVAAGGCGGG